VGFKQLDNAVVIPLIKYLRRRQDAVARADALSLVNRDFHPPTFTAYTHPTLC
jgi:hypothetical protein